MKIVEVEKPAYDDVQIEKFLDVSISHIRELFPEVPIKNIYRNDLEILHLALKLIDHGVNSNYVIEIANNIHAIIYTCSNDFSGIGIVKKSENHHDLKCIRDICDMDDLVYIYINFESFFDDVEGRLSKLRIN